MAPPDFRAQRASLLGVLYAEDFDDDGQGPLPAEEAPLPEPEVIEPTFTVAELEAARAEARAAGHAEAERGLAASRTHMLGLLATGIADGRSAARDAAMQAAESVAKCMLSTLVTCLPAMCERHGAAELSALTRAVLPGLTDEPKIVVRVHPHMLPVMQAEVAALDFELAERVHLLPTEAVAPGDARISWRDGSVTRDAGKARHIVEDALASLGLLQQEIADA